MQEGFISGALAVYHGWLRRFILALAIAAGAAVLAMMGVTALDVILRSAFNSPITGAYDIVKLLGGVAIGGALPYTTAVKGHVAVEFFFQKLKRPGRIFVDTINRVLVIALFGALTIRVIVQAGALRLSGEVTPTLELPLFPVVYFIGLGCAASMLAVLYNLTHPGREMIKP